MNDDWKHYVLPPGKVAAVPEVKVSVSRKEGRRREQFVMVSWTWLEKLDGATGQTYRVAHVLLYEYWRRGEPLKFNNHMSRSYNVTRQSKWRALADLERRGLITVERRPSRSPIIRFEVSHL